MTEGQALAIEQLRAIEEAGALEIVSVTEQPWQLQVVVSLDCSGKLYVPERGVRLKRREWFVIAVPTDFPYVLPTVETRHTRFAGLPHVQWKRHLCLYQAPATEWNVNDGMFGYIARLDIWLDHAAKGELNPSGEALHPPVAYHIGGPGRMVIPRADAPSPSSENWFGFAQLNNVSDTRADIVGWSSLADELPSSPVAPAILLAEPMPFEFPGKMADLFAEFESRGTSTNLILVVLRLAVLINNDGGPLFVVLGTPMRGVAGTSDLEFHLSVWYVDPKIVEGLRLSLHKFNDDPRIKEIGERIEQIVLDWLKSTDVEWCIVREDRPQIVLPRDQDSAVSWFRGKVISLWGCGALGSHLAEYLTRAGVKKLLLHDNGVVTPGLLSRQLFSDSDIGTAKVLALSARLVSIRPGLEIGTFTQDLLTVPLSSPDWTESADVIIETTGSGILLHRLEGVRSKTVKRIPLISMALGHRAKNIMAVISPAEYSGGPLDIDRKLRLECYRRPELHEYSEEFWPRQPRTEIFQPEPGCSDATFIGSSADVALLSAGMLNLLADELRASQGVAIGHLLSQAPSASRPTHKRFSWPSDLILEDPSSGYEVRLSAAAWPEILAWISANTRQRGKRVETGGLLFGEISDLLKIIWVDEVSGPPPDSNHSPLGFVCGVQGTAELANEKAHRTAEVVRFIGMWHTHPSGLPLPSNTDLHGIEQLVNTTHSSYRKSLMMIVAFRENAGFPAAAYIFSAKDFEQARNGRTTRFSSVTVLPRSK